MWHLQGTSASLGVGQFAARVELARPERGLMDVRLRGGTLTAGGLLQIRFGDLVRRPQLIDAYTRGKDLIATYQAVHDRPDLMQLYWRWTPAEEENHFGVEVIASVQTNQLDSCLELNIGSQLASDRVCVLENPHDATWRVLTGHTGNPWTTPEDASAMALLYALPRQHAGFSFVEIMDPADARRVEIQQEADGRFRSECHLFTERLEKGVIRRGRVQGLFIDGESPQLIAEQCYRQFASEPPPLTV